MKKAILFSLLLLFSVLATQVLIADDFQDKPETVQLDNSDIDFDLVSIEPVVSVAVEMPIVFEGVQVVYWREKDVGNLLMLHRYAYNNPKLKPEHFLPDIRRL
jgi:hypothetical protein